MCYTAFNARLELRLKGEKMKTDVQSLREIVDQAVTTDYPVLEDISNFIFHHPELGGEEFESSKYLCRVLEDHGFRISYPVEKLPTAFVAECGDPAAKTVIAFLAEYDALPGFAEDGGPAHACGHNWIAATMCGCALSLQPVAEKLGCRFQVIGTPAEETFGAKYDLIQAGVFDHVDFVFQAHLDEFNSLETLSLAMNSIEFNFYGVPAHAAQNPEKGINALDAVINMFTSINAMRQQMRSADKIHGIITHGGTATNTIPDFAQCQFSIRSKTKSGRKELRTRILKIAEGASLATGARLEYHDYENPYDDMVNVKTLTSLCEKNFQELGIENFIPEEQYPGSGSSDIGNVSYVCPTVYMEIALEGEGEPVIVHDKSALALVNSPRAYSLMVKVVKAYAHSVIDLVSNPSICNAIRVEHQKICGDRERYE